MKPVRVHQLLGLSARTEHRVGAVWRPLSAAPPGVTRAARPAHSADESSPAGAAGS
jgi:hypothetical protein